MKRKVSSILLKKKKNNVIRYNVNVTLSSLFKDILQK